MPELPEVETIRRQLAPAVTGHTIGDGGAHPSPKFSPALDAIGASIQSVTRRGKYLIIGLDDDRELIIHLGMTGRLRVRTDIPGSDDRYVRAWWHLGSGVLEYHDVRRFGRIAVVPSGEYRSLPTLAHLGPEPLGDDFTPEHLWRAIRASTIRVKTQLLSQRPVAGIGNIYADEALWDAGIHPGSRRITRAGATALHLALVEVLTKAIANGGTTLRDYRTFEGGSGSNQFHLQCYGRHGEPCTRCGSELSRQIIDGRGTTLCPICQAR